MRDLLRLALHARGGIGVLGTQVDTHRMGLFQDSSTTLPRLFPRLFRVLPDNLERIGVVGTGGGERADARLLERVPTQVEGA